MSQGLECLVVLHAQLGSDLQAIIIYASKWNPQVARPVCTCIELGLACLVVLHPQLWPDLQAIIIYHSDWTPQARSAYTCIESGFGRPAACCVCSSGLTCRQPAYMHQIEGPMISP